MSLQQRAKQLSTVFSRRKKKRLPAQVLVVDDHALTRAEMCFLIGRERDLEIVGEAGSGEEAIEKARGLHPDVIVMDMALPGITGFEASDVILKEFPEIGLVALSNHSGRALVSAVLNAGGKGYVMKAHAFEELIEAIRAVREGKRYLGKDVGESPSRPVLC